MLDLQANFKNVIEATSSIFSLKINALKDIFIITMNTLQQMLKVQSRDESFFLHSLVWTRGRERSTQFASHAGFRKKAGEPGST